jgi:hypothetical protein
MSMLKGFNDKYGRGSKLPPNEPPGSDPPNDHDENKRYFISYHEQGFGDSKNASGSHLSLKPGLEKMYTAFNAKEKRNEQKQERLKQEPKEKKAEQEKNKARFETATDIKREKIEIKQQENNNLKHEIVELKKNPQKKPDGPIMNSMVQFYIGIIILLPLTLYLLVFYVSASYSAFFKDFESQEVMAAIFDGQTLSKALADGWLELAFVCTIPFAFMGLGYLIHMFQRSNTRMPYIKIMLLFAITFVFDAILAYQIDLKIYEFNKSLLSPPFDMKIAFQDVKFWGIIFAGFITYIIWGLVLDFILKEHDKRNPVRNELIAKQAQIDFNKREITKLEEGLDEFKENINSCEGLINKYEIRINSYNMDSQMYQEVHASYYKGWIYAIDKELALPQKEKDALKIKCQEVSEAHINKVLGGSNDEHGLRNVS